MQCCYLAVTNMHASPDRRLLSALLGSRFDGFDAIKMRGLTSSQVLLAEAIVSSHLYHNVTTPFVSFEQMPLLLSGRLAIIYSFASLRASVSSCCCSLITDLAMPKSAIRSFPQVFTRRLAGLMSLWSTLLR